MVSEWDQYEIKKVASSHAVLTKEREYELIHAYMSGDKASGDLLVRHNYRLVWDIAKRFIGRGMDFQDLIQEGSIGLLKGIHKFDLKRNLKLSTYASWWIRQAISRAIENKGKAIRIPINQQSRHTQLKKAYRKYIETHQEVPTSAELAELCGISEDTAKEFGRQMQDPESLDKPTSDDENLTMLDYIADDFASQHVEEDVEHSVDKERLNQLLGNLTEDERIFIIYRYGLLDYQEKSNEDCAAAFQMPVDAVAQQLTICLNKLRGNISRDCINLDEGDNNKTCNLIITSIPDRLEALQTLKVYGWSLDKLKTMPVELPGKLLQDISFREASELLQKLRGAGVEGVITSR